MAHTDFLLNALARLYRQRSTLMIVYGCLAMLALAVGVLGLVDASEPRKLLESRINIHALFGLLLGAMVLARYQWCVEHSPWMLSADSRELSRHLSRNVYLLLYVVIGVTLSIHVVDSIWHRRAIDFNPFDERFRNGPDSKASGSKADFQQFFVAGLFALAFVRVLAVATLTRARRMPKSEDRSQCE
jgi:cytochrome b561